MSTQAASATLRDDDETDLPAAVTRYYEQKVPGPQVEALRLYPVSTMLEDEIPEQLHKIYMQCQAFGEKRRDLVGMPTPEHIRETGDFLGKIVRAFRRCAQTGDCPPEDWKTITQLPLVLNAFHQIVIDYVAYAKTAIHPLQFDYVDSLLAESEAMTKTLRAHFYTYFEDFLSADEIRNASGNFTNKITALAQSGEDASLGLLDELSALLKKYALAPPRNVSVNRHDLVKEGLRSLTLIRNAARRFAEGGAAGDVSRHYQLLCQAPTFLEGVASIAAKINWTQEDRIAWETLRKRIPALLQRLEGIASPTPTTKPPHLHASGILRNRQHADLSDILTQLLDTMELPYGKTHISIPQMFERMMSNIAEIKN